MNVNFLAVIVAALVPMLVGFIWYNSKVFGNAWMQACGLTEEKMKGANMAAVFGVSLILSFLLSFSLQFMVIHQYHITSAFFDYNEQIKDIATPEGSIYKSVMDLVGTSHRTFKHGLLHGVIGGLFVAMPIIGTSALFERKSFKYIAINAGYWIITMGLMGGILSAWM